MECNYAARLSSCHTIGEKKTQQTWPATSKHCGGIVAINSRARRSPSVGRGSKQCGGGRRRRQARQPNPHGHGGRPLCFGVVVVVSVCEWGPPGSRTATTDDWDGKVYHNGVHRRLQSCMRLVWPAGATALTSRSRGRRRQPPTAHSGPSPPLMGKLQRHESK